MHLTAYRSKKIAYKTTPIRNFTLGAVAITGILVGGGLGILIIWLTSYGHVIPNGVSKNPETTVI